MSLRVLTILIISVVLLAPISEAKKKKKDKAGYIKDGIFTDSIYNYQFTMPEYWKAKINKKNETIRINISTKGLLDRIDLDSTDYYKYIEGYKPLASFWILENKLSAFELMDIIIAKRSSHELKKQILKLIEPEWKLNFDGFHTSQQRKISLGGKEGVSWVGAFMYSSGSGKNKLENPQGGSLILLDIDQTHKMMIVIRSDAQRLDNVLEELKPLLASMKFGIANK